VREGWAEVEADAVGVEEERREPKAAVGRPAPEGGRAAPGAGTVGGRAAAAFDPAVPGGRAAAMAGGRADPPATGGFATAPATDGFPAAVAGGFTP
jgi:hypothetical protein